MANLAGFNANDHESMGFDPIPAGEYLACIVESDMQNTKNGEGKMLVLKFELLEQHKGRTLFARLNLVNNNEKAKQIAHAQLGDICRAVGKIQPHDSSELHDIPLLVRVSVRKREDNGELTNEVKAFKPAKAQTAGGGGGNGKGGEQPPWQR